jgi:hypothetical protein
VQNGVPLCCSKAVIGPSANMAQGADAPPMKSLVAHRLVQAGSCCVTHGHWCVVWPCGLLINWRGPRHALLCAGADRGQWHDRL